MNPDQDHTHFWEAPNETLFKEKAVCKVLGKSRAWAQRARWAGEGPRFYKLGHHVRYKKADILEWIEAHAATSTSEVV